MLTMPSPSPLRRRLLLAVLILALAAPLAACGKKGDPRPPSGDQAPFPRTYPAPS